MRKKKDPTNKPVRKKMNLLPGRKSIDSPEMRESVLDWIAEGKPLAQWCFTNKVGFRTVYNWRRKDPDFDSRFFEARKQGADALMERALVLAIEPQKCATIMEITKFGRDGEEKTERKTIISDNVARSRLAVDTILKLMAKWWPQTYGDRLTIGGSDDMPPIKMTADERVRQIQDILATARARQARANLDSHEVTVQTPGDQNGHQDS